MGSPLLLFDKRVIYSPLIYIYGSYITHLIKYVNGDSFIGEGIDLWPKVAVEPDAICNFLMALSPICDVIVFVRTRVYAPRSSHTLLAPRLRPGSVYRMAPAMPLEARASRYAFPAKSLGTKLHEMAIITIIC